MKRNFFDFDTFCLRESPFNSLNSINFRLNASNQQKCYTSRWWIQFHERFVFEGKLMPCGSAQFFKLDFLGNEYAIARKTPVLYFRLADRAVIHMYLPPRAYFRGKFLPQPCATNAKPTLPLLFLHIV